MAKQINIRNFQVIEATAREMYVAFGSPGICDWCGRPKAQGYYIAVLNQWFCPKCFDRFIKNATYYPSDRPIEDRNIRRYSKLLKCQ